MSEIRFDGRVALITGAGGGLGRAHAMTLAARGAKVVINDLGGSVEGVGAGSAMADKVVEEIRAAGGEAVANYDSVDNPESAGRMIKTALDAFGRIDIVINNAGILRDKTFLKMPPEDFTRVVDVHLNGSFYVTHAAWPHLKENNYGRVIFTTSAAGLYGNFGQTNYAAAKLGLVGLMNALKLEGQKYGITVNTIAPVAGSRMMGTVLPPQYLEKLDPRFVSAMVCYLCAESCKETGGVYIAGGGHYARAAMLESVGVDLAPDEDVSAEAVQAKFAQIRDLTGAKEFINAPQSLQAGMAGLFRK